MTKKLIACKYAPSLPHNDTLSIIGSIFWCWAEADRFGILNQNSPYNFILDPNKEIPDTKKYTNIKLEDLCLIKAREILQSIGNKKIILHWSGGVDSTCILCSLILARIPKDQLVIIYTPDSILENYNFYNQLKKDNFRMIKYQWNSLTKLYNNFQHDIVITGWCADQLFGSNVNLNFPEQYTVNYKDGLKHILLERWKYPIGFFNDGNYMLEIANIDNAIEEFGEYAKKIGLPITYTCEALWLFNFAVKWSHVSMDSKLTLPTEELRKNAINFFEDIRFQEWSISHYKEFYKHNQSLDVESYKKPFKNLIYFYNKDEEYLKTKGKVNSWTSQGKNKIVFTDFCIYDENGFARKNLQENTQFSKDYMNMFYRQELNRLYYVKNYLKDNIDIDEILFRATYI